MEIVKSRSDNFEETFAKLMQRILDEFQDLPTISIGLSGGSLIDSFCAIFNGLTCDWSRVTFFFADERKVPLNSPDSTFGLYSTLLIPKFPTKLNFRQFEIIDPSLSVEECAKDYELKLRRCLGVKKIENGKWPEFDVLLLGIGPDGHTCSLFPGHSVLQEKTDAWVAPICDSPKPPLQRVTLTLPAVNHAKNVVFLVKGASKAAILKDIMAPGSQLPAALVKPTDGKVFWMLDEGAASHL